MSRMIAQEVRAQRRHTYMPEHTWSLESKPLTLQPCVLKPVLPGETMRNIVYQARSVSNPVKHPLIGWWRYQWWYYVPFRAMAASEDLQEMMINPEKDISAHYGAAKPKHFHVGGSIDWVAQCMDAIYAKDFQYEGETAPALIDGMYPCPIFKDNWADSLMLSSEYAPDDLDVNVDANDDGEIMMSEIERARMQWALAREMGWTKKTYEDYLSEMGVNTRSDVEHKPEFLGMDKSWTYPANTVDPETGTPSSALSWSIQERLDKDRFFKEPGFVISFVSYVPKVYLANQTASASWYLRDARSWLPAVLGWDKFASVLPYGDEGPLVGLTLPVEETGIWVDIKDVFVRGDQFVNHASYRNQVTLPASDLQRRFVSEADVNALFVGETPSAIVREDGVARLLIAGRQQDATATTYKMAT